MSGENAIIKVGLIDADLIDGGTRHPNLALMKISKYCISNGCQARLLYSEDDYDSLESFDAIIISKVFSFSIIPPKLAALMTRPFEYYNRDIVELIDVCKKGSPRLEIAIGGTGFFSNGGRDLDKTIEHIHPDYNLYLEYVTKQIESGKSRSYYADYLDYSIGFTTRGCFRKCDFCVNKKYGRCSLHSPVSEFFDPERKKIYLWDDNFFACKDWESVLDQLDATGRPFQFRQGLDIRLMTDKKAERLSKSKCSGDYIFAFDHVDEYDRVCSRLKKWREHCSKETKIYLICAFDSFFYNKYSIVGEDSPYLKKMCSLTTLKEKELMDIEYLFERIRVCLEYDCLPYIMRYEKYKKSEYRGLYTQIARWCNQPSIFKKMSFKEFCHANQNYVSSDRPCASMRAYNKIIAERPDFEERYFNMKFKMKETLGELHPYVDKK